MPRMITQKHSLETMEDEVQFTTAALTADENTQDLIPIVSGWLPLIDQERTLERTLKQTFANVDATRVLANEYLDYACTEFGIDLEASVKKDKTSSRWTMFFKMAVSLFCRQPLVLQISAVLGWLAATDPTLEQHRDRLTKRVNAAQTALTNTNALASQRAQLWNARQQLADDLTGGRDALWSTLAARARERGLPRTWPDLFFQTESRAKVSSSVPASVDPATDAPAAG